MPRSRLLLTQALSLSLVLACACTSHIRQGGLRTLPLATSGDVPVSSDPPIHGGTPIHPPSEQREQPEGNVVYLVDSGSESVYEYDTARGRFLGPAPRVDLVQRIVTLPGYPTVISKSPPQDAVKLGSDLFVAGGLDGTVVSIPINAKGELGAPRPFNLPAAHLTFNGTSRSNGETPTGKPFIKLLAANKNRLVAVSHDQITLTSEAYLIDIGTGHVLKVRQLPDGLAAAITASDNGFVVAMSNGSILEVRPDLSIARTTALKGIPASVATYGSLIYVGLSNPAKLMSVDPRSGKSRQLSTAQTSYSGPVVVLGETVWWALPDVSAVREVDVSTGQQLDEVYSCRFVSAMLVYRNAILATCIEHNQLARITLSDHRVTLTDAGGFPIALVA